VLCALPSEHVGVASIGLATSKASCGGLSDALLRDFDFFYCAGLRISHYTSKMCVRRSTFVTESDDCISYECKGSCCSVEQPVPCCIVE
jgi:hypothetical protein